MWESNAGDQNRPIESIPMSYSVLQKGAKKSCLNRYSEYLESLFAGLEHVRLRT